MVEAVFRMKYDVLELKHRVGYCRVHKPHCLLLAVAGRGRVRMSGQGQMCVQDYMRSSMLLQ
eukprot:5154153-Amphidinium_carterae.1